MNSVRFRKFFGFVYLFVVFLLLSYLHEDINILKLYDNFKPIVVILVWTTFCYAVVRPDSLDE